MNLRKYKDEDQRSLLVTESAKNYLKTLGKTSILFHGTMGGSLTSVPILCSSAEFQRIFRYSKLKTFYVSEYSLYFLETLLLKHTNTLDYKLDYNSITEQVELNPL